MNEQTERRVEDLTQKVLDMLVKQDPGEVITKTYFQKFKSDKPLNTWSFGNQMMCLAAYLTEHPEESVMEAIEKIDYRGFKQWLTANRCVKKGEHAHAFIFNPLIAKSTDKKTGEEKKFLKGFKTTPVFEVSQTDGEDLPTASQDPRIEVVRKFNFITVADKLGITVRAGTTSQGEYGYYSSCNRVIQICTPEEMTFYHELSHAVDDHLLKQKGGKGLKGGQQVDQEIIAQFCSNVLAYITGKEVHRTTAYTKQYIISYLKSDNIAMAVLELMSRINNIIDYIVTNSEYSDLTKQPVDVPHACSPT